MVLNLHPGCENVHDEELSGLPFFVKCGLVEGAEENISVKKRVTIASLSVYLRQSSFQVPYIDRCVYSGSHRCSPRNKNRNSLPVR